MQDLTERQAMILGFIRRSIEERGYPPTLREIAKAHGIRSTNGVNDHLRALERKGFLVRVDMTARGMRPNADARGIVSERCRDDRGVRCAVRGPTPRCETGRAA